MRLFSRITRRIFKILNRIKNLLMELKERFEPFIQHMDYFGFNLYYSRGTSLVRMLKEENGIYEKKTCELLVHAIADKGGATFIDIGANIGLISLYFLSKIPNSTIFAFEPGPHPYKLFSDTIEQNKLEKNIKLFNCALSDKIGKTQFFTHVTKHSSGDGFKDTKRAGKTKKIEVDATTLDKWWYENSKPFIDIIKIDTEGAELLVLMGGYELLVKCKSFIILEICMLNYKSYDYQAKDVVNYLQSINYSVFTENGELITKDIDYYQYMGVYTYYCMSNIKQ